ncbi:MAG: hypothetical protein M3N25_05385 [Actinomycetota bacterium]|nr:hypothetical protein [Actinomycetota bacterium]MDP9020222.1 hypothetical protein [Actinomycetota bacterium]
MGDSENTEDEAAGRGEKLDQAYDNAVAAVEDKVGEHDDKITELGRRVTGMEEDSKK